MCDHVYCFLEGSPHRLSCRLCGLFGESRLFVWSKCKINNSFSFLAGTVITSNHFCIPLSKTGSRCRSVIRKTRKSKKQIDRSTKDLSNRDKHGNGRPDGGILNRKIAGNRDTKAESHVFWRGITVGSELLQILTIPVPFLFILHLFALSKQPFRANIQSVCYGLEDWDFGAGYLTVFISKDRGLCDANSSSYIF